MKPALMTLAVVSALFLSFPASTYAKSSGSGQGGGHGFAGHGSATGAHGFSPAHHFTTVRGFAQGKARGFAERYAGRSRFRPGWRRADRRRFDHDGRVASNGGPSGSAVTLPDAACSGPAIYEVGGGPKSRLSSRLPIIVYGIAPSCSAQSYAAPGPGVYSLD